MRSFFITILMCLVLLGCNSRKTIRVGAKHFTEGYILSEMLAQILESKGHTVERKYNLGGTLVCFEALKNGEIDIYPEYTGTITKEILRSNDITEVSKFGLNVSKSYGFSNSYSLVTRDSSIKKISELKYLPELRAGISYEFLKRQDGWDALAKAYGLPQQPVGLEHGLAYRALFDNKIDVTDCYSTDGEIAFNNLIVLEDDLNFFPKYEAVSFYRSDLDPEIISAIDILSGKISEKEMSSMNGQALYQKEPFEKIASSFLIQKKIINHEHQTSNIQGDLLTKTIQHLYLTFFALVLAIIVAVPLGIWLNFEFRISNFVLYLAGLLQTIPSIALLAIMIPVFGIGPLPAIVALFLYAVLPILRNTVNGLRNIDPLLKEVAVSLRMTRMQSLKYVEWPLALPTILTGIRIAAVINVGTATLAAFIGAGGLGEYIVTGLALNNTEMVLKGAIPAAVLALVIEFIFEFIERKALPANLRKR